MGIRNLFSSLKTKAQDATMEKALERMRDLKMSTSEKQIGKLLATHVRVLPTVKSAKVSVSREGLSVRLSFSDGRPSVRRDLRFVELLWTPHKRAFVFAPADEFEIQKEQEVYACVAAALAAVMQQMLGFNEKKLKEENFSTEVGPVTGVLARDGKLSFDLRRVPLLRQYLHFRVMGQAPMDHLNVTDCWCENGKLVVRMDNNRLVDQIKGMDLDPTTLRKMMKGEMGEDALNEQ
jgi:hypothetical protein